MHKASLVARGKGNADTLIFRDPAAGFGVLLFKAVKDTDGRLVAVRGDECRLIGLLSVVRHIQLHLNHNNGNKRNSDKLKTHKNVLLKYNNNSEIIIITTTFRSYKITSIYYFKWTSSCGLDTLNITHR